MKLDLYDANNYVRHLLQGNMAHLAMTQFYEKVETSEGIPIVVWDGEQSNSLRRKLYPDYKKNRSATREDIYASLEHLRKVLDHSRAIQIEVPGYEADDVIATIAQVYSDLNHLVSIYSSDSDYLQLTTHPNIICGAVSKNGIAPGNIRLYKTWVGDRSDNVPGVPGFGEGKWSRASQANELGYMRRAAMLAASAPQLIDEFKKVISKITLSPIQREWLVENINLFGIFWRIVGFFQVPAELIEKHMRYGQSNRPLANELLREVMWV